jgi:hypothetical protein
MLGRHEEEITFCNSLCRSFKLFSGAYTDRNGEIRK